MAVTARSGSGQVRVPEHQHAPLPRWEAGRTLHLGRAPLLPLDGCSAASVRVFVHDEYRRIVPPNENASVYDAFTAMVCSGYGAVVYSDASEYQVGDFCLLLLCPGVFQSAPLCRMAASLLTVGVPSGGCIPEMAEPPFAGGRHGGAGTRSRRRRAPRISSISHIRDRLSRGGGMPSDEAGEPRASTPVDRVAKGLLDRVIPLYSTAAEFNVYIRDCPSALESLGLLTPIYAKWPATPLMRNAAASHALANALARVARDKGEGAGPPATLVRAMRNGIDRAGEGIWHAFNGLRVRSAKGDATRPQ